MAKGTRGVIIFKEQSGAVQTAMTMLSLHGHGRPAHQAGERHRWLVVSFPVRGRFHSFHYDEEAKARKGDNESPL